MVYKPSVMEAISKRELVGNSSYKNCENHRPVSVFLARFCVHAPMKFLDIFAFDWHVYFDSSGLVWKQGKAEMFTVEPPIVVGNVFL